MNKKEKNISTLRIKAENVVRILRKMKKRKLMLQYHFV